MSALPQAHSSAPAAPAVDFDLESTLPYLLNRAGVRIGAAFSDDIKSFGISLHQWRILASLSHQSPQNVTELAAHTSIEVSTLSRIVTALVDAGLLARVRSGADARSVSLTLTTEGHGMATRIVPVASLYERIALSGMSADEVALLKQLLARVYENVVSLGPAPQARRSSARVAANEKNQSA